MDEKTYKFPKDFYTYYACSEKVIDGDTIDVMLDQGLHNFREERLRVLHINAPEKRFPTYNAGIASMKWVEVWIKEAEEKWGGKWPLVIKTEKDPDSFGRYLGIVWRRFDQQCIVVEIIKEGHAVPYKK